jgi:hypothetical protein
MDAVNPTIVVQSALALTVAITCTDAIRDIISTLRPHTMPAAAIFRAVTVVIVIIIAATIIRHSGRITGRPAVAEDHLDDDYLSRPIIDPRYM